MSKPERKSDVNLLQTFLIELIGYASVGYFCLRRRKSYLGTLHSM